jgi:hypothetical protein
LLVGGVLAGEMPKLPAGIRLFADLPAAMTKVKDA